MGLRPTRPCCDLIGAARFFQLRLKKQPIRRSKIYEIRAKLWKKQKGDLTVAFS
jgi:hypothetical protein